MVEMDRERSDLGAVFEVMSTAADGATPSPKPTKAREKQRPGMVPRKEIKIGGVIGNLISENYAVHVALKCSTL